MKACFFIIPLLLAAGEWPQFRGENASGVSDATGLPTEFGPGKNVVWKTPLPRGHSSPVLTPNRIFLTGFEGGNLITFCLDRATGKILWRREIAAGREERLHKYNDRASSTPATDGTNVFVFFGDFGLVSYGPDGNERWRIPLGPFTNLHGMASSPILADGMVLQVCDQDTNSFLMAVDQKDGKTIWKVPRPEVTHGFSTPVLYRPKGGPAQVVVPGSYQLTSYALKDGKKLWWVRGLTWQVKSAPVLDGDILYFNGWAPGGDPGQQLELPPFEEVIAKMDANRDKLIAQAEIPKEWYPNTWSVVDLDDDGLLNERDWSFYRARRSSHNSLMAVRLGGSGDMTASSVLWRYEKSIPDVPSPLLYRGVLYLVRTGGIAASVNPKTGEPYKVGRLMGALADYYASPVAADGKVFMISQTGKVSVLQPGPQWEVIAQNDLEEECQATPAFADGHIYLRTRGTLYCFGTNGK